MSEKDGRIYKKYFHDFEQFKYTRNDWIGKPYCPVIHANCIYPEQPGECKHCMQCEHFPIKEKLQFCEPFDYSASEERLNDRLYGLGIGLIWSHFEAREDKRFIVSFKKKQKLI